MKKSCIETAPLKSIRNSLQTNRYSPKRARLINLFLPRSSVITSVDFLCCEMKEDDGAYDDAAITK